MRGFKFQLRLQIIVILFATLVYSCSKESNAPAYQKFVSKNLALQLRQDYMQNLVDVFSQTYPDLSAIKPLISSDVIVYKIVYKTVVNNHDIEASGLVCVPATHGDYPVLSFQNGTNTVDANAPSMNPTDYAFQMIELVASTGYVVVVPDYPGFGASASVPHPYLVKEPTVTSIVDMLAAVKEFVPDLPGINLINEYYLLGYSQGGWATLALHKSLELDHSDEFNLAGSACGAGPYDLYQLMQSMIGAGTYNMPVYIGYIVNAYISYSQFTNPVTDIFNEPYASRISTLYTGQLSSTEINNQLTTSIPDLLKAPFLAGFDSAPEYSGVRDAMNNNSITAWQTGKPIMFLHGANDTDVNPSATENIYSGMISAGTSQDLLTKVIIPGADHGQGIIPSLFQGIQFLNNIKNQKK
jgi:pimeloyl-ACP methyl ester carboxylesterase